MRFNSFPSQGWVLQPSFAPKQVTFVSANSHFSDKQFLKSEGGKVYKEEAVYETKFAAIAAGRTQVEALEADLKKRRVTLDKRIAALDKAEGKTPSSNTANAA